METVLVDGSSGRVGRAAGHPHPDRRPWRPGGHRPSHGRGL